MNRTQQFFFISILVNIFYLIITFIFFYGLESPLMSKDNNDYLTFHNAGLLAINDISNLYNSSLYLFPFRYFPLSAYFFTPFSLLGLDVGYFIFQLFNFFLNFANLYLIYRIIQLYKNLNNKANLELNLVKFRDLYTDSKNESFLHQNAVILIMLPQFMNYFLGQINIIVLFVILLSLLFLLKEGYKNDFLGGLFLGIGILIKPTLILVLPFIILLKYNKENKKFTLLFKKSIIRLSGSIILILISGLYFLFFPQMLEGFIDVNLGGKYTYNIEGDLNINPSFSLTRIVLISFELIGLEINGFLTFIIIILLIFIPIYILFILNSAQTNNLLDGYLVGILVMFIVYFDTWPHHLVVLAPFLVFFITIHKDFIFYKMFKYLYYLMAILVVIFWGIFYLTYEILPINIGGLILFLALYITLIMFYKRRLT